MPKRIIEEYNDLKELHFAKKSYVKKDNGEVVNYKQYRYYYNDKNYIVIDVKNQADKSLLKKLADNNIIIEDK